MICVPPSAATQNRWWCCPGSPATRQFHCGAPSRRWIDRTRYWSASGWRRATPRICRRCDAAPSLESPFPGDPLNRTGPTSATRTGDRCTVSRSLAESRGIRGIARTDRRRTVDAATTFPKWARPPQGQTRLRWGLMMGAESGIGLSQTGKIINGRDYYLYSTDGDL